MSQIEKSSTEVLQQAEVSQQKPLEQQPENKLQYPTFTQDSKIQYDFTQSSQHQQFLNLYEAYNNENAQPIQMPVNTNFTMQQASQIPKFTAPSEILSGNLTFDNFMKKIQNGVVTTFQSDNLQFLKNLANRFIASQMLSNPENQQIAFIDSMKVLDSTILANLLKGSENADINQELQNVNYVQCQNLDNMQELLKKIRNYQIQSKNTRLIMLSVNDQLNFKNSHQKVYDEEGLKSLMKFKQRLTSLQETLKQLPCPVVLLCQSVPQQVQTAENSENPETSENSVQTESEIPVDTLITCKTVQDNKTHLKTVYSSVTEGEIEVQMD